jgi:hypothetical protein
MINFLKRTFFFVPRVLSDLYRYPYISFCLLFAYSIHIHTASVLCLSSLVNTHTVIAGGAKLLSNQSMLLFLLARRTEKKKTTHTYHTSCIHSQSKNMYTILTRMALLQGRYTNLS